MKTQCCLMFIVLSAIALQELNAQQNYPAVYTPTAGDTLTALQRKQYNLFPTLNEFQWASFCLASDSSLIATVCILRHGARHRFVIERFQSFADLERDVVQSVIKDDEERSQRSEGVEVVIGLNDDTTVEGELLMIGDSTLIVETPQGNKTIPWSDIRQVMVKGESKVLLGMGIGLGAGVATGMIIGAATAKEGGGPIAEDLSRGITMVIGGAILGGVGLLVGGLAGRSASTEEMVFDELTQENLIILRKLARYPLDNLQFAK